MANKIVGIKLQDGTELDATALSHIYVNSSGNLYLESDDDSKLTLYSKDNLAVKFNDKIQLDTAMYVDEGNKKEVRIACICDSKNSVEGLKIEAAGTTFITEKADSERGWDKSTFKMMFKEKAGSNDVWTKLNAHASSIDLRTRTTEPGTGGGIAAQVSSCDSNFNENKFKIETDRKKDVFQGLPRVSAEWEQFYTGEGGKGIEIGTINSQFESVYTSEMRRGKETKVFAAERSSVQQIGDKFDYQTQEDDSKDIIDNQPFVIRWIDIVNAAAYLKDHGLIPTDSSYYTPENVDQSTGEITGPTA